MYFYYKNKKIKLIFLTIAGSRMFGTHFNKGEHPFDKDYISDKDYKGVFISSVKDKLSLEEDIEHIIPQNKKEKIELITELNKQLNLSLDLEEDISLFEIKKFFRLLSKQNPDIIDMGFAKNNILYFSKEFEFFSKNKKLFLNNNIINTFVSFGEQQLHRIKNHKKMINKYPKVNIVLNILKQALKNKDIDKNFISTFFNYDLFKYLNKNNDFVDDYEPKIKTMEDFYLKYIKNNSNITQTEFKQYHEPLVIDYLMPKSLKGQSLKFNKKLNDYNINNNDLNDLSIEEILKGYLTFRKISETQYNVFTDPNNKNKIFLNEKTLFKNEPAVIGDFIFQVSIDKCNIKKESDKIKKLYEWKINRHEKRNLYEVKLGYDAKHGAHLIRLLLAVKEILIKKEEYDPYLSEDNIKIIKDILNCKYSYEDILILSQKLKEEINKLKNVFSKKINEKEINNLLFKISIFNN